MGAHARVRISVAKGTGKGVGSREQDRRLWMAWGVSPGALRSSTMRAARSTVAAGGVSVCGSDDRINAARC